jgi:hypothetical protein
MTGDEYEKRMRITARIVETRAAMICCAREPLKMARALASTVPPGCNSDGGVPLEFYLRIAAWEIRRREDAEEPYDRVAIQATDDETARVLEQHVAARVAH